MSSSVFLDVLQGSLTGQRVTLGKSELVIGREAVGGLQLADHKQVSRRHARLWLQNDVWLVEDLGSTNGTFVNGARISSPLALREGDLLQLGDFQARFGGFAGPQLPPNATQMSPLVPPALPPQPFAPQPSPHPLAPQQSPQPFAPQQSAYPLAPQQPPHYQQSPHYQPPPKSAGTAVLCSFLLVGGGQFYNGEVDKGLAMLCASFFCGIAGFFTCGLTFFGCFAIWLWSIIDASQSADRINSQNNRRPF